MSGSLFARISQPLAATIVAMTLILGAALPAAADVPSRSSTQLIEGRAELLVLDDPAHDRARERWTLRQGDRRIPLRLPARLTLTSGSRVRLQGRQQDGAFVVERVGRSRAPRRLASTGDGTGPASMRVAVIMATLPSDRAHPLSLDTVRDTYFSGAASASRFYEEVSNGRLALDGRVFGWYDLDTSATSCDIDAWMAAAEAAAGADGYLSGDFSQVSLVIPSASCGFAGAAVIGGRESWIRSLGADGHVVLHELGHNLGARHASAQDCDATGCSVDTYGDPFSVMGASAHGHPNAYQRAQMTLLREGEIERVDLSEGHQQVHLAPASVPGGSRLVRLVRPDGRYVDMELRRPYGRFEDLQGTQDAARSVLLYLDAAITPGDDSVLLDATPETPDAADQGLPIGRAWVDARAGMGIAVVAVDDAGADVEVTLIDTAPTTPDREPPTEPLALDVAPVAGATGVRLTWAPALDAGGGLSYAVLQDGRQLDTTSGLTWTRVGLAPGERHTWSVRAIDGAGSVGPARSLDATTQDRAAPPVPRGLAAAYPRPGTAIVRWSAATDASGIAGYRLTLDGRRLRARVSLSRTLRGLVPGVHRVRVWAMDGAGNEGRAATLTLRIGS